MGDSHTRSRVWRFFRSAVHPVTDLAYFARDYPRAISLLRVLPKSIDSQSVPNWREWNNSPDDRLIGFDHFVTHEEVPNWAGDIGDIDGFSSSKSRLEDFKSTSDMVIANSREMLREISEAGLKENLAHTEIRIIHNKGIDSLRSCSWDRRIFLMNSGGSHHFSAAKLIANELDVRIEINGTLNRYSINPKAVQVICDSYRIFLVSGGASAWCGLHDALKKMSAPWARRDLPHPYDKEDGIAIFLPKNNKNSMAAARILDGSGFLDLSSHLRSLLDCA